MSKSLIPFYAKRKNGYFNYNEHFFSLSRLLSYIFLLILFSNKAFSQDTLNIVTQTIQNFDLAKEKKILFDEHSKTYNISIKDKNSVHQILLDSNYKLIGQYTEKRDWIAATTNYESLESSIQLKKNILFSSPFTIVNNLSTENGLEFIDIFLRKDDKAFYFQKNSFVTNSSNFLQHWVAEKKETLIDHFKEKNCFYWITFSTKENDYTLYKLNSNLLIESTSLKCLTRYNKNIKTLEIVKVDTSLNVLSNHHSSAKIKLYFTENIIYITDNNSTEKSTIIHSINKKTLAYLSTNIYSVEDDFPAIIKSNSFIYQNKLIQALLTKKEFHITVHDIESKKKITAYTINKPNSTDSVKAYLFEREELFGYLNDVSNLKSIWDEQAGKDLFIHAFLVNDSLQITAGTSAIEKDLITPIISTAISYFLFYNIFTNASFLLHVKLNPTDKLSSLYYTFNLNNDTLINLNYSKKFENPISSIENKFIRKNESSIVSILPKNDSRVYICFSKKKNTFSFIRFVTK